MSRKKKNLAGKCKRCGKCCLVWVNNKWTTCPYLLQYVTGKTRCMIYPHRIDVINAPKQYCTYRENIPYDFPDCPYNEGLPIHPKYIND